MYFEKYLENTKYIFLNFYFVFKYFFQIIFAYLMKHNFVGVFCIYISIHFLKYFSLSSVYVTCDAITIIIIKNAPQFRSNLMIVFHQAVI